MREGFEMAAPRIIVLSDGTGNAASKVWRTNVWRVFELLDLTGREQVAKYDDGVGSSAFKPLALLGGAFGWGLKRNIIDLYKFVCRNYEPGAQIYAFGFSRGAFTVRVLVALILEEGLVTYHSESDLHARAKAAYRAFRAKHFRTVFRIETIFRAIRNIIVGAHHVIVRGHRLHYDRSENTIVPSIEFIGVWDTVAAYGLPIEEMTRGVSQYLWPLYLPERSLHPNVRRACHALSLDDERTTFHPVLWSEKGEMLPVPDSEGRVWLKDERISQVWFPGVHANAGGGYPDDALAYMPLYWIMQEAALRGLIFKKPPSADPNAFLKVASARDPDGRQYDSRAGLAGYYRYGPRKIADLTSARMSGSDAVEILLPKIHESVLIRLRSDSNAYAPIGIPAKYGVATVEGEILEGDKNPYETPLEAAARAHEQERIWNWVWLRRIVYFLTLAASFHLVAFWRFHEINPEYEYESNLRLVSEFIRFIEAFLPRLVVRWWTDAYAANPGWFLIGVLTLAAMIRWGSNIGERITDSMRRIWIERAQKSSFEHTALPWAIYKFRTSKPYQTLLGFSKRHLLPFIAAVLLFWLGLTASSHFLFNVVDSTGVFCQETPEDHLNKDWAVSRIAFDTSAMCSATGVYIQRGKHYQVTITVREPWMQFRHLATPEGFQTGFPTRFAFDDLWRAAAVPIRRVFFRRWFVPLARIGAKGNAEVFLDSVKVPGQLNTYVSDVQWSASNPYVSDVRVTAIHGGAERSGELFLYVNDAVLPFHFPPISDWFYRNHTGSAEVLIRRLD